MKNIQSSTKVFLSSTGKDLSDYRETVFRSLQKLSGFHCVRMEDFVAADESPLDYCVRQVEDCDVFIGILGHYYGSCPENDNKSFTEHEYDSAVRSKKPRLMFLASDDLPVPANLRESEETHNKQTAFRDRVLKERIISKFKSPDELALDVTAAIFNLTSRASTQIENIKKGKFILVVEGSKTTEIRIEEFVSGGWSLTTNSGDTHLKKVTIIPASTLNPIILDFSDGRLPMGSNFKRYSGGHFYPHIGGDLEYAEIHVPRFEEVSPGVKALLLEPSATNYLLDSNNPKSQWVSLGHGVFTLWVSGGGVARIKFKGSDLEGISTEIKPFTFKLDIPGLAYIEVNGSLSYFQLNSGRLPLSVLPTTSSTKTRAEDKLSISMSNY